MSTPNHRWYHLTPARFFLGLLAVQVLLFLSERFQWFWFNEHKGWTVLIAVGVVLLAVLVMLLWGLVCLLLRRRFQFSFRSLLLFIVAISVPLGWFAWEMQRARRQRETVEAITEMGGGAYYGEMQEPLGRLRMWLGNDFFCQVVSVNCRGLDFDDDDASHLRKLPSLTTILLSHTQITDAGLEHLRALTKTQLADNTRITDNGLVHLTEMTELCYLSLNDTEITDDGMQHLKEMTELRELFLARTHVTDNGLANMERMTQLKVLWLDYTQVTDKGLAHLDRLTKLEELQLWGTRVTDEGVQKLQRALPNCEITH